MIPFFSFRGVSSRKRDIRERKGGVDIEFDFFFFFFLFWGNFGSWNRVVGRNKLMMFVGVVVIVVVRSCRLW